MDFNKKLRIKELNFQKNLNKRRILSFCLSYCKLKFIELFLKECKICLNLPDNLFK